MAGYRTEEKESLGNKIEFHLQLPNFEGRIAKIIKPEGNGFDFHQYC